MRHPEKRFAYAPAGATFSTSLSKTTMPVPKQLLALLAILVGLLDLPAQQPAGPGEAKPEAQAAKPATPAPTPVQIEGLIKRLDSDDFRTRETAQVALTRVAKEHTETALDLVLKGYLNASEPEARYRLRSILYQAKLADFKNAPRGFVGIVMRLGFPRDEDGNIIPAVRVDQVLPESAAERDGLQPFDHIISIDGTDFANDDPAGLPEDATSKFAEYVTGKKSGDEVKLEILRGNQPMTIDLTLGKRPPELYDFRSQEVFEKDFKNWLEENSARLQGKSLESE